MGGDGGEAWGDLLGAETGGFTVADGAGVGADTALGGDATGEAEGDALGEAEGEAPGALAATAEPITKANIKATNTLEKAISNRIKKN